MLDVVAADEPVELGAAVDDGEASGDSDRAGVALDDWAADGLEVATGDTLLEPLADADVLVVDVVDGEAPLESDGVGEAAADDEGAAVVVRLGETDTVGLVLAVEVAVRLVVALVEASAEVDAD